MKANSPFPFMVIILCMCVTPTCTYASQPPQIAGCDVFACDSIWNRKVDDLPVDPATGAYIQSIGAADTVHADFGSGLWDGGPIGIPFIDVPGDQERVAVSFDYDDESDFGPYGLP
jgi:hypothetical protein